MTAAQSVADDRLRRAFMSPGRDGVLLCAARRFVAQGFAATTVRQIAQDSGIKAASIYHHFASKEDLFVAVLEQGIQVMVDAWDSIAEQQTHGEQLLQAHVRAHLGALFEHGPFTAAHVTAFFTAPAAVRERVVPVRDDYERRWNTLLGETIGSGPDRRTGHRPGPAGDLSLLRPLLFGAMNSTIEWFDPKGQQTLDHLAQVISDQFLNGVSNGET